MALASDNCGNLTGSCDIFCLHFFQICDKFELLTSQRYCSNILRYGWNLEITHGFYGKFSSLYSGEENENRIRFEVVAAMSLMAPFLGDTVYFYCILLWYVIAG